ncbi:MAG: transporter ATP-binding protein [Hyphomicrobiales bacterium]|nr:transporter ATP-binding protein [Hyphomicrobiales bacterium]
MNDVVIRAEGLGKKYLIGHQTKGERYTALRDVIAQTAKGLARSVGEMARGRQIIQGDEVEEFWALKDVNFEIKRGDVLGIIGRNGAGKSTLLKILSRITEPSAGRVEIKGRIASLLEVGTGFHPELTGRENIYLNGAILGMSRAEIRRKFDEIVAFAEVDKFLDTPVKRYSSGMYVRLAFAVAAHLEPEILVVDEVLAVGDAEFQKKCLGKMGEVAGQGRTVLFVSHNMGAVANLCSRAITLSSGRLVFDGSAENAIMNYGLHASENVLSTKLSAFVEVCGLSIASDGNEITADLQLTLQRDDILFDLSILIYSDAGVRIAIADLRECLSMPRKLKSGRHRVEVQFGPLALVEGDYEAGVFIGTQEISENALSLRRFSIAPKKRENNPYPAASRGFVDTFVKGRLL